MCAGRGDFMISLNKATTTADKKCTRNVHGDILKRGIYKVGFHIQKDQQLLTSSPEKTSSAQPFLRPIRNCLLHAALAT